MAGRRYRNAIWGTVAGGDGFDLIAFDNQREPIASPSARLLFIIFENSVSGPDRKSVV